MNRLSLVDGLIAVSIPKSGSHRWRHANPSSDWIQLAYQLADGTAGMAYTFVVSCALLYVINWIPGLKLRASVDEELLGMDETEIGEFAYDYVELTRDVVHGIEDPELGSFKNTSSDLDVDGREK